jgi:hypothetical protein
LPRKKDPQPKAIPRLAAPRRCLLQGLTLFLLVAALLGGLVFLGKWSLEQIRGQERYAVPFADIDCTPPQGMERGEFLGEVQYYARLPDRIDLLDNELSEKLAAAFARHPWVEKVDGILLVPPRHVEVRLVLRRAVLAVPTRNGLIAVDRHGVCLPKSAATEGLPVFEEEARPPQGPAGTKWGDPKVEERARQGKKGA